MAGPHFGDLYAGLPETLPEELYETLVEGGPARLCRIVSTGHATPEGEWYDQAEAEWVVILAGSAELLFEGEPAPRRLEPGAWVFIPPHCRHRVAATDPARPTVWLALHIEPVADASISPGG